MKNTVRDKLAPYLFLLPFILSFFIFFVFPAVYSLFLSFHSYKGYGAATFVGWENYHSLLTYGNFWVAVRNTVFYWLMHTIPVMFLSFILAVLLNSKLTGAAGKIIKPVLFLPQIVSMVSSALVWRIILGTNAGVVNELLGTHIPFLENAELTRWAIVLLVVWRAIGWFMVIYLSGLTTISEELTDASKIDGAVGWQSLVYITIPLMKPIFMFAFMMDAISSLKIFTEPNVLTAPGAVTPPDVASIMNILTMNMNGGSFGMASAAGWLLFIMIAAVSAMQLFLFGGGEQKQGGKKR